jgi:hypothetical protein
MMLEVTVKIVGTILDPLRLSGKKFHRKISDERSSCFWKYNSGAISAFLPLDTVWVQMPLPKCLVWTKYL